MYNVMIVDDMEVFRRDIKRLKLWGEISGFAITAEAFDGRDALKKLEENPMDLVITDIRMPVMDGIELLREISEKKLCPYTVLLSDFTEYNYARQGFVYGAFDYISKSIDEEALLELLGRIKQQLDNKQQEEQKQNELQGIVEETLLSAVDIKQISETISKGETIAIVSTAALVDMIGLTFHYDKKNALLILRKTINEIVNETLKNHPWIDLYIDIIELKDNDFSNCKNWNEVKETVLHTTEQLISVINLFIGNHDNEIIRHTCEYILKNVNEKFNVSLLAERLFISKSYLSELFKQKIGFTLLEYITMVKMERAKVLLKNKSLKAYEIAYQLGYKENEYFSKVFKKYTAMSLSEYRQGL